MIPEPAINELAKSNNSKLTTNAVGQSISSIAMIVANRFGAGFSAEEVAIIVPALGVVLSVVTPSNVLRWRLAAKVALGKLPEGGE